MKLNSILEKTNKALSANAGLIFLNQLIEQLDLENKLSNFLPVKKKERGISNIALNLRLGNTFSAEGSEVMIRQVFKKIPKNMKRYFRADSAYGRVSVYNELINANVNFAIVLRENLGRHVRKMLLNQHSMKWLKTRTVFSIK